jgi:seryl-tRNA synthetase
MLDIKWIRENPADIDAAMQKRGAEFKASEILKFD